MEMKKNDRFVLKIEDMGENGEGIGRLDGYIWFVKDAVIGDVIEAGVTKMKKQYGFARLSSRLSTEQRNAVLRPAAAAAARFRQWIIRNS